MTESSRTKRLAAVTSVGLGVAGLLASCGNTHPSSASPSLSKPVTLTFTSQYNGNNQLDSWVKSAAKVFEKANPNVKVQIKNIVTSSESTYYAKLDLEERSAATSPDVTFEDSFLVKSDAAAGYIRPLPQLTSFSEWKREYPTFQQMTMYHKVPYAMMIETDVQQLYYDAKLFKKAGLPAQWQPHSFSSILKAAEAIKAHDPGIIPMWIYTGTPLGEASSFRGFEVLLDGTKDRLYNTTTKKWETGGPGFNQVFQFLQTLHSKGLEEGPSYWSNPNAGNVVDQQLMPAQKVGIVLDGSWVSTEWLPGGPHPWPQGFTSYNVAQPPTVNGAPPGVTDQSGGWTLAVPTKSPHPRLALKFIETATSPSLLEHYDGVTGQLPVETNVAHSPVFKGLIKSDPLFVKAVSYVKHTHYRPGFGPYNQISADIAALTGKISLGQITAKQAEQQYAKDVTKAAGAGHVQAMSY